MIFVYIEDKQLLAKAIDYLDHSDWAYTTNIKDNYHIILIAEINSRTLSLIKTAKQLKNKVVFITYNEENKILKHYKSNNQISIKYRSSLYYFLNMCDLIISSLPIYKEILNQKILHNIIIIEKDIKTTNINYYNKYNLDKRNKKVIFWDSNFNYLDKLIKIALANPKNEFILLGYKANYQLNQTKIDLLNNFPKNIKRIKYYDYFTFIDLLKISNTLIYLDKIVNMDIIYETLKQKKNLIVKENDLYNNYLKDNRNIYTVDNKKIVTKTTKLLQGNIANLTLDGYEIIKNNNFSNKITKINNISL